MSCCAVFLHVSPIRIRESKSKFKHMVTAFRREPSFPHCEHS
jgi:hypothetical protein